MASAWDALPEDIRGEILSWCPVPVWCFVLNACRRGRAQFPYGSIRHMTFTSFKWIPEMVHQFDLPALQTARPPRVEWHPCKHMVEELYGMGMFLEAYPRVRFHRVSIDTVLFMQCATQYNVDARMLDWYSRADTFCVYVGEFSVRFQEDPLSGQSCGSTMTWPRLVGGGFNLILNQEKRFLEGYITPRVPLWMSIFNAAHKLSCRSEGFHSRGLSLTPWIDRRICTLFWDGWKSNPEYFLPALTGRLDADLSTQSPYLMCDLVDHVDYFLQHHDAFDKADVSVFISARFMCQLTCDDWIRVLSSRRAVDLGLCNLVVLFLWHADRLECMNVAADVVEERRNAVADMLVERMINADILSFEYDIRQSSFVNFAPFPIKKQRKRALETATRRRRAEALSHGYRAVAIRCDHILENLPQIQRDDDTFFSSLDAPVATPWQ